MNSGYNPNFRGRCAYDSVAELSPIPINIVPPIPIDPSHYPPIIDLTCGTQGNSGDVTTLCAQSLFRTDSIVSNRRYYARMCTITAPEGVITVIVVSDFASYVTLWKDQSHYWTSTNGTLTATLDSNTSGVLALEITTVNPYTTGGFTVDLSCGGGVADFEYTRTACSDGGSPYTILLHPTTSLAGANPGWAWGITDGAPEYWAYPLAGVSDYNLVLNGDVAQDRTISVRLSMWTDDTSRISDPQTILIPHLTPPTTIQLTFSVGATCDLTYNSTNKEWEGTVDIGPYTCPVTLLSQSLTTGRFPFILRVTTPGAGSDYFTKTTSCDGPTGGWSWNVGGLGDVSAGVVTGTVSITL